MKKRPPRSVLPRIALFDIETSPQEGKNWGGTYEVDILEITRYSHMLAWSVKELDGKITTRALPDYSSYKRQKRNDKALVKDLHNELAKYDLVVGQNGDRFDIRYMNARFAYHNLPPIQPFKTVDTLKAARRYFLFPSNKLNELLLFLGFPPKVHTGGYNLWRECIAGDTKAWALMKKYNAYDVEGLEYVYKRLLPFIGNHPNLSTLSGNLVCKFCGSSDIIKRRKANVFTKRGAEMSCKKCGGWFVVR